MPTSQQSLSHLKTGLTLTQNDFFNITQTFVFHPSKNQFLLEMNSMKTEFSDEEINSLPWQDQSLAKPTNVKLAETLLIFRNRLQDATTDDKKLKVIAKQVFYHYIINTKAPIIETDGEDAFDVFNYVSDYAESLVLALANQVMEER